MTDPAEIRAYTAAIRRARAEYARNPTTATRVTGPCLRCGERTGFKDGICTHCRRKP